MPNSFVIKCNHGCKWQYIIKNKEEYLKTKQLFSITRRNITGWLEQEYWCWNGFEMQYKGIKPKLLIESYLTEQKKLNETINVYCFKGEPKLFVKYYNELQMSVWDENFKPINGIFKNDNKVIIEPDELLKECKNLSEILSKEFKFVRVDFMLFQNRLYFEELAFTPYSVLRKFDSKKSDIKLGSWLKGIENEF